MKNVEKQKGLWILMENLFVILYRKPIFILAKGHWAKFFITGLGRFLLLINLNLFAYHYVRTNFSTNQSLSNSLGHTKEEAEKGFRGEYKRRSLKYQS